MKECRGDEASRISFPFPLPHNKRATRSRGRQLTQRRRPDPIIRRMKRMIVFAVSAFAVAGCGGSSEDGRSTGQIGGREAEERLAEAFGATPARNVPLRLCDGTQVDVVSVSGSEAIDAWRELRGVAADSGFWPVLIGSPDDARVLADTARLNCKDGAHFERTLKRASEVNIEQALSAVARAYGVRDRDLRGALPLPPYRYAKDEFLVPLDVLTGEPLPEVAIALLPIDKGWQATAILPWGNYNDNPGPAVHTAILRDWGRRYGAELVSMTGDVIEASVARPPTSDQAALALAREQYSYSPDIVQQGLGDVETLAASLKKNHAWYFWWD
jgi:hypothetical protein